MYGQNRHKDSKNYFLRVNNLFSVEVSLLTL